MAARGVTSSALDARVAEVERIAESSPLSGSESLCRLLRYLANRAIQEPGVTVREHEIAAEVFGRAAFDPRIDSTVRVNVARLRAKLIEYYNGPGADSSIIVELPKGSYTMVFHTRPAEVSHPALRQAELKLPGESEKLAAPPLAAAPQRVNRVLAIAFVAMTVIAAMLAAALMLDRHAARETSAAPVKMEGPSVQRFWGMLLRDGSEPWVVFSNAAFVGRPATGMRYLIPSRDSGREVLDFYTGTGEVLGIHALDCTFARLNRSMRVKRGGLLSLDDVENNNVVYVGSPLENLTLRDVPGLKDFAFRLIDRGPRSGEGSLINLAPHHGEPPVFLPSPLPLSEDFAVVALVPGLNPAHWSVILAGTSTIGTQAAVEYVCREDTLRELFSRLGNTTRGALPQFEAVLHVEIKGGVPVRTNLVALHRRNSTD
jgi:hypothetical protein